MLKIKRKMSGETAQPSEMLNRNQIMFYAGLLGLLDRLD